MAGAPRATAMSERADTSFDGWGSARRWTSRLWVRVVVPLVVLVVAFEVFAWARTQYLWFRSVGDQSVFTTLWVTRFVLALVFGAADFAWIAGMMYLAYRLRPRFRPADTSPLLLRYRAAMDLRLRLAIGLPAGFVALWGAVSAAGQASTFLAWRHQVPFGVRDPYFGLDASFFVFTYPWLLYLVDQLIAMSIIGIIAAGVVHLMVGGFQGLTPRRSGAQVPRAASAHLSVLVALFMVSLGLSALLSRYGYELSNNSLFTGVSYTDEHVRFGAKLAVALIAFICAGLFLVNAWTRRWSMGWVSLILLLVSSIILLGIYPASVQQFKVRPSEPQLEALVHRQSHLGDPRRVWRRGGADHAQLRGHPDRYRGPAQGGRRGASVDPVDGPLDHRAHVRGTAAEAELLHVPPGARRRPLHDRRRVHRCGGRSPGDQSAAIPDKTWSNVHTVYTHGYGVVAAYGNRRNGDEPAWIEGGLPPTGALNEKQGRIYFGEQSSNYVVVGAPPSTPPVELDTPALTSTGQPSLYTYQGSGGVPIGNWFTRLLYAAHLNDLNLLLSNRVNADSRILTDREPVQRVEQVAPWLVPDSDPYPTVVDGRIVWVIDCYTMTANYPNSQEVGWQAATSDSASNARSVLFDRPVNYVRNAVKATVDAYNGTVNLYAWDESDPILKTWENDVPRTHQAEDGDPGRPAEPPALPAGPVHRAALDSGPLPRDRPGSVVAEVRPVAGARRPDEVGLRRAAALLPVGAVAGGEPAGVQPHVGFHAERPVEPHRLPQRRRGRVESRLRSHAHSADGRHRAGAGAGADLQRDQLQRVGRRQAAALPRPGVVVGDLRQPSDPAGRWRHALRRTRLHADHRKFGQLPGAALRRRALRGARRNR